MDEESTEPTDEADEPLDREACAAASNDGAYVSWIATDEERPEPWRARLGRGASDCGKASAEEMTEPTDEATRGLSRTSLATT